MRSRSPQTKSGYFPISRRFSQPKPLESETDTEAAEEVPEGEKKSSIAALLAETMQRIDPQDPRTALYAYLNGRTAACDVDNVALVYPFGCNASQKLAVQRALGNRVSVVEGPPGTGKRRRF